MEQPNSADKFTETLADIKTVLQEYDIDSLLKALFISNIWLPNVASPIKHLLFYSVLITISKNDFLRRKSINSYTDFSEFLKLLHNICPDFPWIEDYVPETDWGEVKYTLENTNYKIYYGTELSNIYDYISHFEALFSSLDKEYTSVCSRSPAQELKECINLQDTLIKSLSVSIGKRKLTEIIPGFIEIPPETFWQATQKILSNNSFEALFNTKVTIPLRFTNTMYGNSDLNQEIFESGIYTGKLLPYYSIQGEERDYPLLPRRYSSILIDQWFSIFEQYEDEITKKVPYDKHLDVQLYGFLRDRNRDENVFAFPQLVGEDHKPCTKPFGIFLHADNKILLIKCLSPFNNAKTAEKELRSFNDIVKENISLIKKKPLQIGFPIEKRIMAFEKGKEPKVEILAVLPQTTTLPTPISGPKDTNFRILFLDQFLAIFDEINSGKEIVQFLDYWDSSVTSRTFPITSALDLYASFKDSYGVLIEGAREPNRIMLDPNWGSNYRFNTLKNFWQLFPDKGFFDLPRSWQVEKYSDSSCRLISKKFFGIAMYMDINGCDTFINAPFDRMDYTEGLLSNLIIEAIEDILSKNTKKISQHAFFKKHSQYQLLIFPDSLVKNNDTFKHLRHLLPEQKLWEIDGGYFQPLKPGMRLVFNFAKLSKAFENATDRSIQVDLTKDIIEKLNAITPDNSYPSIIQEIEKYRDGLPRFKVNKIQKQASFPDFVKILKTSTQDTKLARKKLAELCLNNNIKEGNYSIKTAKPVLNKMIAVLIRYINDYISNLNIKNTLPILIEQADALSHENALDKELLKLSKTQDVDYSLDQQYSKKHSNYIRDHKNIRYLIEKFIQINPSGKKTMSSKDYTYLFSLVDILYELQYASDSLHYDIYPTGLNINRDFVVKVNYHKNFQKEQDIFGEEEAKLTLGLVGNESDRVDTRTPIETYLDNLDAAFKQDLGFSYKMLLASLDILSIWASVNKTKDQSFYYSKKKEIAKCLVSNTKGLNKPESIKIIDFITLEKPSFVFEHGILKDCGNIPIWEHKKRPNRYPLKPLTKIGNRILWGPNAAYNALGVWSSILTSNTFPYENKYTNVQLVIDRFKDDIEKNMELKSLEIVKRLTPNAKNSVKLHDYGAHPENLGDYDVLAYLKDKNIILNIEDKNIMPAYCLKDTMTLRDTIFSPTSKRYLEKVENREKYLKDNLEILGKELSWEIDSKTKVISVFVTRYNYWWTKFPPRDTNVLFQRIDLLENLLRQL